MAISSNWLMTIRVLTALVIGYFLTILYTVLMSKILMYFFGVTKVNATVSMQLLSFLIYAMIAMWVFSISSLKKIYLQITYSALISLAVIYLINMGLK